MDNSMHDTRRAISPFGSSSHSSSHTADRYSSLMVEHDASSAPSFSVSQTSFKELSISSTSSSASPHNADACLVLTLRECIQKNIGLSLEN